MWINRLEFKEFKTTLIYVMFVLYSSQVKTSMDSFKDSIDTTLASKAEQVASAASESADLIKKRKKSPLSYYFV